MQTTTLYLVRHGETDYNRRDIVQGRGVDAVLNATGRTQAAAVARRLSDVRFDAIYTSTLRRAVETAEAIARAHQGVPFHHSTDLEEMDWGIYEGVPSAQIRHDFEAITARWRQGDFGFRIEGGESILDVQQRGQRAVGRILEHHPGQTVLAVTHGRFLRVLVATLLEGYGLARMHEIQHANTAVNALTWRAGRCEAGLLNCTAHLDDQPLREVA